ncbi:MAG TPA: zf-HC2 domain-containing protein [Roseiflexaceae bacterium]|nr:zf-HC2 domain-containing protein [Roseiflexaceae bacterium]
MNQSVTVLPHPYEDVIPAFALGALEPEETLLVKKHLAHCPDCRAEMAAYQAVVALLCNAISSQEPPAHLRERILTHIAVATKACAATST